MLLCSRGSAHSFEVEGKRGGRRRGIPLLAGSNTFCQKPSVLFLTMGRRPLTGLRPAFTRGRHTGIGGPPSIRGMAKFRARVNFYPKKKPQRAGAGGGGGFPGKKTTAFSTKKNMMEPGGRGARFRQRGRSTISGRICWESLAGHAAGGAESAADTNRAGATLHPCPGLTRIGVDGGEKGGTSRPPKGAGGGLARHRWLRAGGGTATPDGRG